jgi:signal transduction histidine kinase
LQATVRGRRQTSYDGRARKWCATTKPNSHLEPLDVVGITRAAVTEFREEAAQSGFEVDLQLEDRTVMIRADQEALRRAIRNLLENAVKYSPDCRTVWVKGHVNNSRVAISVRDRGIGIDAQEQREIFRKFVRGSAAKRAGIKGTGIGLSMVRQIVEACGGEIRLESAEGAGSTFTIVLPLLESGGTKA